MANSDGASEFSKLIGLVSKLLRWGILAGIAGAVVFVLLAVLVQTGALDLSGMIDRITDSKPLPAEEPLFDDHMQPTARFCRENPRNCTPYVPPDVSPTGSPPPRPETR